MWDHIFDNLNKQIGSYQQNLPKTPQQNVDYWVNQMNDPTNYFDSIMSHYSSSPMYQQQIAGSMDASNQAQKASGMAQNPQLQAALQGTAQNTAQKGSENYLNAALQHGNQQLSYNTVLEQQAEKKREAQEQQDSADKGSTMSSIGTVAALAIMLL